MSVGDGTANGLDHDVLVRPQASGLAKSQLKRTLARYLGQRGTAMNDIDARLNAYQPQILSIYRIMFGLLYFQHGISKWFGFPNASPPNMTTMLMIAGTIELVGALLV